MALEISPNASLCNLSGIDSGSLIRYRKELALSLAPRDDRPRLQSLAVLQPDGPFALREAQINTEALNYGNNLVLRLEPEETPLPVEPGENTDRHLFLFGDGPRIMIYMGGFNERAFVKLKTGELTNFSFEVQLAVTRWRLGVRDAFGEPVWLIRAMEDDAEGGSE